MSQILKKIPLLFYALFKDFRYDFPIPPKKFSRILSPSFWATFLYLYQRRKLAEIYEKLLNPLIGNSDLLSIPRNQENEIHTYHLYVIRVNHKKRDLIKRILTESDIPISIHYPKAIHQNIFFSDIRTNLPNTEKIVKEILTLPLSPYMKYSDVYNVANILKRIL